MHIWNSSNLMMSLSTMAFNPMTSDVTTQLTHSKGESGWWHWKLLLLIIMWNSLVVAVKVGMGPLVLSRHLFIFIFLLISFSCTQWVLNPQPHHPSHYYGRMTCQLSYSSLVSHTIYHQLRNPFWEQHHPVLPISLVFDWIWLLLWKNWLGFF